MLLVLCLSACHAVHSRTIARGAAVTRYDLRIFFQITRDDWLAPGIWVRPEAVDSVNAQGAEPLDLQRKLDDSEGSRRGGDRTSRAVARYARRIQTSSRLDRSRVERNRRRRVRNAGGRFLRYAEY